MRVHSTLLAFVAVVSCWAQTPADPQYNGSPLVTSYAGGYFINWDYSPEPHGSVVVYGPGAKRLYSDPLGGSDNSYYPEWAVDSDGVAVRSITSHHYRIELLDRVGKPTLTIDPGLYIVTNITFGPDHTIWTLGYEFSYESQEKQFNIIRHYSRTGEKLGQFADWAQIPGFDNSYPRIAPLTGGQRLYAAQDRLGFQAQVEKGRGTWIEVSYDGKLLGTYDLGVYAKLRYVPAVMTPDGDVYARIRKDRDVFEYARLDRSQKTWMKLSGYPKGSLIGADNDKLIFAQFDGLTTVLHPAQAKSLTLEPLKGGGAASGN